MPHKCTYYCRSLACLSPILLILDTVQQDQKVGWPRALYAHGVFYYHRHLSPVTDYTPSSPIIMNRYITHINVYVFVYMRHLLYVFLSIPGRGIPHMWLSCFFYIHIKVFLTRFEGVRTKGVSSVQIIKPSKAF